MRSRVYILTFFLLSLLCACNGLESKEQKDSELFLNLDNVISNVQNGSEVADIAAIERDGRTVGYNVLFADGCGLTLLGQSEGSAVTGLSEDDGNYYLELEGGEKVTLPKSASKVFKVELTGDEVEITDGGSVTAGYKVTGAEGKVEVAAMVGEGWSAKVTETSETEGTIEVTAPDPITTDKVLVSFQDARGRQVVKALRLTSKSAVKRGHIGTYTFYGLNYYSIDPNQVDHETALRRYKEVVDAGIDIMEASSLSWWLGYNWYEEALISLDLAQEVGLKLSLIVDRQIYSGAQLEHFVRVVKDHPALWGYKVMDEPDVDLFPAIRNACDIIRSVDGKHPCYINLFGTGGVGAKTSYDEYVERFVTEIDADFISFDAYPCMPDWVLDNNWYPSLEVVSAKAKKYGLDLWAFATSCRFSDGYGRRPKPDLAAFRFQHYTNLMYGAQCLEYFVWGVVSVDGEIITDMDAWPTNPAGDINTDDITYESIKTFNQEVQNRAFVFDGCDVKWVAFHNDVPRTSKAVDVSQIPEEILSYSTEADLVMSLHENDGGRSEYFCIKGRTHLKNTKVHFRFGYPVQTVERDGSLKSYNAGDYDFTIEPGDILIIKTK